MRFSTFINSILIILFSILVFTGFQCGSPEMEGAKLAVQQKNYTHAKELLEKEVHNNPKNEDAWFMLGKIQWELRNYSGMIMALQNASEVGTIHSKEIAQFRLGSWGNVLNEGAAYSNRSLQITGDSVSIYKELAIRSFQNALLINPDSMLTYRNLGTTYLTIGKRDSALQMWNIALSKQKNIGLAYDIAREHFTEASKLRSNSENEKANHEFFQTIKILADVKNWNMQTEDNESQAYYDDILITSYLETGDTATAMKSYGNAVNKDPNHKLYRWNFGFLLMKANKLDEAQNQFTEIIRIDPEWEDGYLAAGEVTLKIGMKLQEEARKKFGESKKTDAVLDTTFKSTIRKAIEYFEIFTSKNPNNAGAWTNLGTAYVIADGNDKRGKVAYDKADALKK
ncbi:MAG: tetratricopeptide repeat protein [Ignavibacteria bacterium]|nr:tetratricopeptide repeat protein [Ignavibacteria bacterium]